MSPQDASSSPLNPESEAARAALGRGRNAQPGKALTLLMRTALVKNRAAAEYTLQQALRGLNRAGRLLDAEQKRIAITIAKDRIAEIDAVLRSGVQAERT